MPVSGAKLRRRAHPAVSNEMRRASVGLCSKLSRKEWLGYQDSNLGMSIPKTDALPLGDTPTAGEGRDILNTIRPCNSPLQAMTVRPIAALASAHACQCPKPDI